MKSYISISDIKTEMKSYFLAYEDEIDEKISISPLGEIGNIQDSTTKFLISDSHGNPISVLMCSNQSSPNLVKRGVTNAEEIRSIVGRKQANVINSFIKVGYIYNCSYAIIPWYREIPKWKPAKIIKRQSLKPQILKWLITSNQHAVDNLRLIKNTNYSFRNALIHLKDLKFLDDNHHRQIDRSIERIEASSWKPNHTIDHNDMWLENIMLKTRRNSINDEYPFVIIDWVGANKNGYGIYDLIRISNSLRLSDKELRRELNAHSEALNCELEDTLGHLLACLGRLHKELEYFPEDKYHSVFSFCFNRISRAIM